jgi:hypothetical protein
MKKGAGFVADGLQRLLRSPWYRQKKIAIEEQVRAKYAAEVSSTNGYRERTAIERKIDREIREQLKGLGSPYCLWLRC